MVRLPLEISQLRPPRECGCYYLTTWTGTRICSLVWGSAAAVTDDECYLDVGQCFFHWKRRFSLSIFCYTDLGPTTRTRTMHTLTEILTMCVVASAKPIQKIGKPIKVTGSHLYFVCCTSNKIQRQKKFSTHG